MKSLLAKFSRRKAIGLYVGDREITVSYVASTALGPVELSRQRETFEPGQFNEVFQRLLRPLVSSKRRRHPPIGFSLPTLEVFFSTRPMKAAGNDVSPLVLLHEVLRSSTINVDDMVVDLIQAKPGKRPIASIASCRKKYLSGLLASMQECEVRPFCVEPAPCALLRVAVKRHRAPRRAKTVIRIFLGENDGLGVLVASNLPVVWRPFLIPAEAGGSVLLSTVRSLEALAKHCGTESAPDAVMIHGRPDLRAQVDLEAMQQQIAMRVSWHDGPALDPAEIAYGVALGCLTPSATTFDLSRGIKPRASLWDLFPWGQAAMQIALFICLGLFLSNYSETVSQAYAVVRAESGRRAWLGATQEQNLQKEKKDLELRAKAIQSFLSTRILWSAYARDIPERLPANATLNVFQGVCEMEQTGKKDGGVKPKKSFMLRIGAPIAHDGTAPHEIDRFLDSLRAYPGLKRDFPMVELADIKWFQPFLGARPVAFFNVMCTPKPIVPGAPRADDPDKKKAE